MLNKRSMHQQFLNVCRTSIFSHPDYTVGFGIAPNPAKKGSRAQELCSITADREFHPAPKIDRYEIIKLLYLRNGILLSDKTYKTRKQKMLRVK